MRIAIGLMGGTIAMTGDAEGLSPSLDAAALLAAVPALERLGEISAHSICNVGSPSITFENVLAALEWADGEVRAGADGVVLTHGTDTLEETAYLLDLLWPHDAPLVVTGAMRAPDDPGADGPANLLAACRTATARETRALGVLVTIDDDIFVAPRVRKAHSFATGAFHSPWGTAVGRVVEDQVELRWLPYGQRPETLSVPRTAARVAVMGTGIGDDGAHLRSIADHADGLVMDGVGAGHVPEPTADVLEDIAREIPVVVSTRTGGGRTGRTTYGYAGAEIDLMRRGIVMAGHLNAAQARLLLWVILGNGADHDRIAREFALRG